jgi:serine/threonine protein kinase
MNLWRALFGSMRRQSAAPTASASQPENIPALRNAPAPLANRKFESPFKIGDRIGGRYEVRRILGGGMGVVYVVYDHEARNVLAPKILALKTFQDRSGQNFAEQHALERAFEKEASAWIALDDHLCIVQATSVQKFHGRLFIAMEYIPPDDRGRNTLRHFLVGHPLPLEQVLRWGTQFCHGMEHAFSKGVLCHRDIKPDNILISVYFKGLPLPEIIPDNKMITIGCVKITDFGLAGVLDQSMDVELPEGLTATTEKNAEGGGLTVLRVGKGQVGGTPGYVAPEVLRGDGADVRSDVYSFGVVLYQMVTGNPSLPLVNRYQLAPLARVDSVLWPVIERCLQAEARSRYQSFKLLRDELEDLLRRAGGVVSSPLEIKELNAAEWSNKGFSWSNLGRHDVALACYDRALGIDGSSGSFWLNKGKALSDLGREEEAIVCFDRALEIDPTLAAAFNNKGTAALASRAQRGSHCLL